MGESPEPTQELETEIAELRARVEAIEGALNALIVVYGVRRMPPPGGKHEHR